MSQSGPLQKHDIRVKELPRAGIALFWSSTFDLARYSRGLFSRRQLRFHDPALTNY
jgi:hypothetical protein